MNFIEIHSWTFMNKHNTVSTEFMSFSYTEIQQSNLMTLKTNTAFILCNINFTMLIEAFHSEQ